jgi:hypothetical protein
MYCQNARGFGGFGGKIPKISCLDGQQGLGKEKNKTYVVQFAEAEGHHHVHFHVIPRMVDQPEGSRGAKIFNYLGVSEQERVSEDVMNDIARHIQSVFANMTAGRGKYAERRAELE